MADSQLVPRATRAEGRWTTAIGESFLAKLGKKKNHLPPPKAGKLAVHSCPGGKRGGSRARVKEQGSGRSPQVLHPCTHRLLPCPSGPQAASALAGVGRKSSVGGRLGEPLNKLPGYFRSSRFHFFFVVYATGQFWGLRHFISYPSSRQN